MIGLVRGSTAAAARMGVVFLAKVEIAPDAGAPWIFVGVEGTRIL